jgi:hypothetical protein
VPAGILQLQFKEGSRHVGYTGLWALLALFDGECLLMFSRRRFLPRGAPPDAHEPVQAWQDHSPVGLLYPLWSSIAAGGRGAPRCLAFGNFDQM